MSTTAQHTHRCGRCHRVLTDAKSIASGYGPTCVKRVAADLADYSPEQVAKALTVIKTGGVIRVTSKIFRGLHEVRGTYRTYQVTATDCTCTGALERGDCYHIAAVRLATAA
ncbi:DUF6011 domain-containing protein [Frankia sp. Cj3]|uniref:DUF6011 domain-containing protein n=1 Tax=Frankia sp. Cj3 TaxID=2880976 RepID=UPI001EF6E93D|nr:DUF6011 domain-containing protein [Frankia sp. Cj3]